MFRTKHQIALELINRALDNGIQVAAWTFDGWYSRDSKFLDSIEELNQVFVAEIPTDFHGWLIKPKLRHGPRKSGGKQGRRPWKHPRVARRSPSHEVQNLVKYSPIFRERAWQRYRIKDAEKGPQVWEVKWAPFWRKDADGLPSGQHCLIVARNPLTGEMRYFVANRVPGNRGITVRWLLRMAFGRWPIENCFRQGKEELGLDHYEVRGWRCVHRHFYVTQLSQLFCARVRQEYDDPSSGPLNQLTIEQVRSAMNTWLAAADLPRVRREERYQAELNKECYYQDRNRRARKSHTKTTISKLAELGIAVERIKSCIPRPSTG